MALAALDFVVRRRQGELRFGMVVPSRIPPTGRIVTGFTMFGDLSPVLIHVAGGAVAAEPQIRTAAVFDLDFGCGGFRYVCGLVTLIAKQGGVLSGQRVAGLLVIQIFRLCFPADEIVIAAVVLRMAVAAGFPAGLRVQEEGVQAAPGLEPAFDFLVTSQALLSRTLGRCPRLI